jgi:competence protein ComEC
LGYTYILFLTQCSQCAQWFFTRFNSVLLQNSASFETLIWMNFKEGHDRFWNAHPALLLGLGFLMGVGAALFEMPIYILGLFALYVLWLRHWAALLAIGAAACYCMLYADIHVQESGKVHFSISSVRRHKTPFQTKLVYRGKIDGRIPCSVSADELKHPANRDYVLTGKLIRRGPYDYTFKATAWEPIPYTFSLAEMRWKAKSALRSFLFSHLSPKAAELLTSLTSGEVEDRLLRYEFGRLGLQHILAISGFHFGILIAFLALSLRFLPHKIQWGSMIFLTTLYFVFIGDSPAVQRAYLVALLFLLAKFLRRPTAPINLLGTALFVEVLFNPLILANLGFQFSFASCFGILLFLEPLKKYLPIRPPLFTNALCITLAVNIALLPLLLLHFGKFPLLSLLYNLFIPFLIALLLFSFLGVSLIALLIPTLTPLFSLIDFFTTQLLDLISYPPLSLDYSFYLRLDPYPFIPLYFFSLLCFSIWLREKELAIPIHFKL